MNLTNGSRSERKLETESPRSRRSEVLIVMVLGFAATFLGLLYFQSWKPRVLPGTTATTDPTMASAAASPEASPAEILVGTDEVMPAAPAVAVDAKPAEERRPTKAIVHAPDAKHAYLADTATAAEPDPRRDDPPSEEVQNLIDRLTNRNPRVRKEAAEALGRMGAKAKAAVPALKKRLGDNQFELKNALSVNFINYMDDSRPAALKALRAIAPEEVPAALAGALRFYLTGEDLKRFALARVQENSNQLRAWAAMELSKEKDDKGKPNPIAVEALVQRVSDGSWFPTLRTRGLDPSKGNALEALLTLAPDRALEALEKAAESENDTVRQWALRNLPKLKELLPK